jgi:uncharacterized protein YecE (DUF72 family)
MSVEIRAGTSGFSFPEWKGNFYPEKLPAKDMLRFYAERFGTVEVNNTFYRMPKPDVLTGWAAEVPEGFRFAVKGSQQITHMRRLKEVESSLARLYEVTAALGPKLGCLFFQLPPNFKKDVPRLVDFLAGLPDRRRLAMEFRNTSWFDDEVYDALRHAGVALCVADTGEEPAAPLVATADWGYLRLRREEFGDDELRSWVDRIRQQPWTDAFVFLKHEEGGIGPKLAARLMEFAAANAARPSSGG